MLSINRKSQQLHLCLLREQITCQNHMSLLWEHWPKALAVKEVILTYAFEPLCPKTFQLPLFSPKKILRSCHILREKIPQDTGLQSEFKWTILFSFHTVEKIHPSPKLAIFVRHTPEIEMTSWCVWGGERASRKLQICQGKCSSERVAEKESVKKSLSKA